MGSSDYAAAQQQLDVAKLNASPHLRFMMLGGLLGLLRHMERAGVHLDDKLCSRLLNVLPEADSSEHALLEAMNVQGVVPSLRFLTTLLHRARSRDDSVATRRALALFEQHGVEMDIVAWSAAAINICRLEDAQTLLAGMQRAGLKPGCYMLSSLLQASQYDFDYKIFLVDHAWRNSIIRKKSFSIMYY